MRRSGRVLSQFCIAVLIVFASFSQAQPADAPTRKDRSPAADATALPEYPLVIRVDHTELELLAANQVDEWGRVDQVMLGTHAVGKSHTQGAISVQMVPDRKDASFDVVFQGRTHVATVGTHGPALICSHTDTDFVCTRPITFHARGGFVAAECKILANTNVVFDGFGSSRGWLGHRLISRIARRRADESLGQVRQIAARLNEAELRKAFDKRLDTQLAAMNQKMNLVKYVNLFTGQDSVQLATKSSKDWICIGVGPAGSAGRLTGNLPDRGVVAPIEIWVHQAILGDPVAKFLHLAENTVIPQSSRSKVLTALAIGEAEAAGIHEIAVCGDWLVLGLQNDPSPNPPSAITQSAVSAPAKPLDASTLPHSERP
jgi:hypothetical protein